MNTGFQTSCLDEADGGAAEPKRMSTDELVALLILCNAHLAKYCTPIECDAEIVRHFYLMLCIDITVIRPFLPKIICS